jgi:hypothetical protein
MADTKGLNAYAKVEFWSSFGEHGMEGAFGTARCIYALV